MKRTIFIGQAMPRVKRDPHDWPSLNAWLNSIGITDRDITSNFYYSALVDYFPGSNEGGSHRVPTADEIAEERDRLKHDIETFEPELFVTIGKLSITHCLQQKNVVLRDVVGRSFEVRPYGLTDIDHLVVPLPHPSGASTWYHKGENKELLQKALMLLKRNLV